MCEMAKGSWRFFLFETHSLSKARGRVQAGKLNMNYSWTEKAKEFGKHGINRCPLLTHHPAALPTVVSVSVVALEQLLTELEDFLRILDKENLSSTAVVKKSFLSDLLKVYTKSSGTEEENQGWGVGCHGNCCGVLRQHFPGGWWEEEKMEIRRRK